MKYTKYILLFFCLQMQAQNYLPFVFDNFKPEWSDYVYPDSLASNEIQIYELQDILIQENDIYSLYTIYSRSYITGFFVNKLSLSSGEKLWSNFSYSEIEGQREHPSTLFLINDTLVVYSFAESESRNSGTLWYQSNMKKWFLNSDNGKIISSEQTDDLDTTNTHMVHPSNLISPLVYGSELFYLDNSSNSRYIEKTILGKLPTFLSYDVNAKGHSNRDTIIELKTKFENIIFHKSKRLEQNKIFSLIHSKSIGINDSFQLIFRVFDSDWKKIEDHDISSFFVGQEFELSYLDTSVFIVTEHISENTSNGTIYHQKLLLFDLMGNLIQKVNLVENNTPIEYQNGINVMYLPNQKKMLVLLQTRSNTNSYWEWFLSSNSNLETMGKLKLENNNDLFYWSFFNTSRIYMRSLEKGNILINAVHSNYQGSGNSTETKIPYLLSFSLDKLKETVSTDNFSNPELVIYPNPVNQTIHIDNLDGSFEYNIFNMQGKLLLSGKLNSEIGVHDLIQGFYVLKLYSNSKIYTRKFVKM